MSRVRASEVFGRPEKWLDRILRERDEDDMDDFLETNWIKKEGKGCFGH